MTFLVTITNRVKSLYQKVQHRIISWIFARKLTVRQVDTIATKLDIFGGVLVTQAFVVAGDKTFLHILLLCICIVLCAILWTIAFILKGYEKWFSNKSCIRLFLAVLRLQFVSIFGLLAAEPLKSLKKIKDTTLKLNFWTYTTCRFSKKFSLSRIPWRIHTFYSCPDL